MPRKYPPLTPLQVCKNLKKLGFRRTPSPRRTQGDHRYYEDEAGRIVQVDMGENSFGPDAMKLIINNAGVTRKQFYGASKQTAKKIDLRNKRSKK